MFETEDLQQGYVDLLDDLLEFGEEVSPRGQKTLEWRNFALKVYDPVKAIPLGIGRKLNMAIGYTETAHAIAGVSDLAQLRKATENFRAFSDDGVRLAGAYGPRIYRSLGAAVKRLETDRDTRQAVVPVWRPGDAWSSSRDVPCTVYLNFAIRGDRLLMTTHMRSSDAWLGLPYDAWMFTRTQLTVASAFGIEPGPYVHVADSFHLYERNINEAQKLPRVTHPYAKDWPKWYTADSEAGPTVRFHIAREMALQDVMGYGDSPIEPSGNTMCVKCRYILPEAEFDPHGCGLCKICHKDIV